MNAQYPTPTKEGFYWAKWKIAEAGTREGDDLTPSDEWEVMHVVENGGDPQDPEYFLVMVPGVEQWQSRENFYWGPGPLKKPEAS